MEFKAKLGIPWAIVLLASLSLARAESVPITVLMTNNAGVAKPILIEGEQEAARILGKAGVDVLWINCPTESPAEETLCHHAPDANHFTLHMVLGKQPSADSVFGMAFLGNDGNGKCGDVFFNRIQQAHRDYGVNTAFLMGAITAHELGHLLLGSHAHSLTGIMEPVWRKESLRQIAMGTLLFTQQQASLMQKRNSRQEIALSARNGK